MAVRQMAGRQRVILNIGEGSFEQGFPVMIQIGSEGQTPHVAETGRLPAFPSLPLAYQRWQSSYYGLGLRSRIKVRQITTHALKEDCHQTAQILSDEFNTWLSAPEFRPIQDIWRETLSPTDEIRVLLQTNNAELQRLPWHLWEVFDRYPNAEIGLSSPVFKGRSHPLQPKAKVAILAILGDSDGIDVNADRALLEQLPNAEIEFLVEPTRQQLTDHLHAKPWNILFFAGHSRSQKGCGLIDLNPHDSLTFPELKHTLRKAVESGLQLAILNSCDGLDPARDLADLQIPQTIFMREPVPDRVAQEFLKHFLAAFSRGEPLYLAVRHARERLEAMQHEFLYATWLPVIYQHPAIIPPTWQDFLGERKPSPKWRSLLGVLLTSAIATTAVVGVRQTGLLQSLELKAYDQLMQARSLVQPESSDDRILVVEITDRDYDAQKARGENLGDKSLSDTSLIKLLDVLEKHQPRAIGLDLMRDAASIAPPQEVQRLRRATTLFGACKGTHPEDAIGIAPPAGIPKDRIGFVDAPDDPEEFLRRQVLFMDQYPDSPCQANYALSTQLALTYLKATGITHDFTDDKHLKIKNTEFTALRDAPGFYQQTHLGGSQILLNYRAVDVQTVSLTDALQNIPTLGNAVRDRIVLIGVTRQDSPDRWLTPYHSSRLNTQPGVMILAQQVSNILSAVLDQRPLLKPWAPPLEILWIAGWAGVSGVLIWVMRSVGHKVIGMIILMGAVWAIGLGLLLQGSVVPVIPVVVAIALTGGTIILYQTYLQPGRRSEKAD